MTDFSARLLADKEAVSDVLTRENGKPLHQALSEVELCARLFRRFAERVLALGGEAHFLDSQPGLEQDLLITRSEPLGVIAAVLPFNFPVELFAHKVAPAIATGNSVVVKPSEETPMAVKRAAELLNESGLPQGVVQIVFGGEEVGKAVVSNPIASAVSFTGSTEAGVSVATTGARMLKRVVLELGGNDPMVVLADADIDLVVRQATFGRSLANGQCCCANKRLIVEDSVYGDVADALHDRFGSLRTGDPTDTSTELGPLITLAAAERVEHQVEQTLSQGASALAGGSRHECFYTPTVLLDVTPEMDIARDMEVFGPVLPLIRFQEVRQAVSIANTTRYGLSASVFSSDMRRAMEVATQIQAGQVVINGTGLYRPDLAQFGGYKHSGEGREGLSTSLSEYTQVKTISFPGMVG
jgi:acyl-CoA reductase-like NAD-dependent aldehyde dehydrogenase